jgi:hypothetical protein
MEANLPGGFIFSQGTMGGRCIICIIPHPAGMLDPGDHISYRTICFLDELKRKQGYYRGLLLQGGAVSVPANTLYPVLIVSPPERLESGLLAGFLRTELLSQEFEAGRQAGEALVNALSSFMAADDEALNEYLLENKKLPDLFLYPVPRPRWWALWANPRWLG